MDGPKVTVAVQAFNHEAYVAEALDSVLMQRVDFPVEVLVGDDCSTDATREIIAAYERRYPEWVNSVFPEAPMGHSGGRLFQALLERATGEYVAVLDGDDFWIHEDKLRRQVAALDRRSDCSISFHDVVTFFDDGHRPAWNYSERQGEHATIEDLLGTSNIIPTCSVLYRNRGTAEYPDWLWTVTCQDWALHILNARFGDITFLPDRMSAYRLHEDGVWSQLGRIQGLEEKLQMLSRLPASLPSRYLDQVEYARSKIRTLVAIERAVPQGDNVVLVASDGDHQLLELDGREGRPFPTDGEGSNGSRRPPDGASAIANLEHAQAEGAEFLVIPAASRWWLTHYRELAEHLDRECARIWTDEDAVIYRLRDGAAK
jgi:glycosyltransferase involved in cell wall biosynthesis